MLGSGTQTDPFIVKSESDLNLINTTSLSAYYQLANDITMENTFYPIGTFSGVFDGNGYRIYNLTINQARQDVGFISYLNRGTVKNLGLENVNIKNNGKYVGGICGEMYGGLINNCYVTGSIKSTNYSNSGNTYYGGIAGQVMGTGKIQNCYAKCTIRAYNLVAGIVGYNYSAILTNCYSASQMTVTNAGVGMKLAGIMTSGTSSSVVNCFYDYNVAGFSSGADYSYPKTTEQMKTQSTYTNWDFNSIWSINGDYPTLQVFGPLIVPKIQTVTVSSYANKLIANDNIHKKKTNVTEAILSPVFAEINKKKRTQRTITTYSLPFVLSVDKSNKLVRNITNNVTSFINPVCGIVERKSSTFKSLISILSPIQAHIDILEKSNVNTFTCDLNVLESPSMASFIENKSNNSMSENISQCLNTENKSELQYFENPSYVEVIKYA